MGQEKRRKIWIKAGAWLLAGTMGIVSYAAEPGTVSMSPAAIAGYDEETWKTLTDQKLEYSEIDDLVKNFNPDMSRAWENFEDSKNDMSNMIDQLARCRNDMKSNKKDAKDDKDMSGYIQYYTQEMILDAYTEAYRDAIKVFDKMSTRRQLEEAQTQISDGVRQLMISYQMITEQKKQLTELERLYDSMYRLTKQQETLGMTAGTDVLSAYKNLLSAQSTIKNLETTQDSLRRTLLTMTGWSSEDQPEIGEIPESNLDRIDTMNPDLDIKKAIGNNFSLIEKRHVDTNSSKASKQKMIVAEDDEQKLFIILQGLYQQVCSDRTAYEAAKVGMSAAEQKKQAADTKYQLGMMGEAEYISAELEYVQKTAALKSADLSLFQAMESYDWAVDGNVAIE